MSASVLQARLLSPSGVRPVGRKGAKAQRSSCISKRVGEAAHIMLSRQWVDDYCTGIDIFSFSMAYHHPPASADLGIETAYFHVRMAFPMTNDSSHGRVGGRPGGVSGFPRSWCRSVSWVRIPPSAYSYKFVGTFSCAQLDLRKARERELATLR